MGPAWDPPGSCRPQMGPMNLAIRNGSLQNWPACAAPGLGAPANGVWSCIRSDICWASRGGASSPSNPGTPSSKSSSTPPVRDTTWLQITVWCGFNMVIFSKIITIPNSPRGQGLGCLCEFELWFKFCIDNFTAVCDILPYWTVLNC